jgi:hypothetical protein
MVWVARFHGSADIAEMGPAWSPGKYRFSYIDSAPVILTFAKVRAEDPALDFGTNVNRRARGKPNFNG